LGLMLADTLTAGALKVIYELDSAWSRELGAAARRFLRKEAIGHLPGKTTSGAWPSEELFAVAARIGLGQAESAPVIAGLNDLGRELARLREPAGCAPRESARVWDSLAGLPAALQPPLRTIVEHMLSWARQLHAKSETAADANRTALSSS